MYSWQQGILSNVHSVLVDCYTIKAASMASFWLAYLMTLSVLDVVEHMQTTVHQATRTTPPLVKWVFDGYRCFDIWFWRRITFVLSLAPACFGAHVCRFSAQFAIA